MYFTEDLPAQPQHMVTSESDEAGSEAPERIVCTLQQLLSGI